MNRLVEAIKPPQWLATMNLEFDALFEEHMNPCSSLVVGCKFSKLKEMLMAQSNVTRPLGCQWLSSTTRPELLQYLQSS
jgi:hypothetical protein